jgi:hypothetical protein
MRNQLTATLVAGLGLAFFGLTTPPTMPAQVGLAVLAGICGGLCAYLSVRESVGGIQRTVIAGAATGALGGILAFAITVAVLLLSGRLGPLFDLHSLNLTIVGIVQLTLTSGMGGLIVGILSKRRYRSQAVVKE